MPKSSLIALRLCVWIAPLAAGCGRKIELVNTIEPACAAGETQRVWVLADVMALKYAWPTVADTGLAIAALVRRADGLSEGAEFGCVDPIPFVRDSDPAMLPDFWRDGNAGVREAPACVAR